MLRPLRTALRHVQSGQRGASRPTATEEQHTPAWPSRLGKEKACRLSTRPVFYPVVCECILVLITRRIAWALENPTRSWLFAIDFVKAVLVIEHVCEVRFQAYMFGAARPKWTSVWHWPGPWLGSFARTCDGKHTHAKWDQTASGKWATSLETVYPHRLCTAIATALLSHLKLAPRKALPVIVSKQHQAGQKRVRDDRISAGVQPRGAKARRLLPEHKQVLQIKLPARPGDPRTRIGYVWPATRIADTEVPAKAVAIRAFFPGASGAESDPEGEGGTAPISPTRTSLWEIRGRLGSNDVYIGRHHTMANGKHLAASRWMNPYRLQDCASRVDCVRKFEAHLLARPDLIGDIGTLAGKRLVCHCAPKRVLPRRRSDRAVSEAEHPQEW